MKDKLINWALLLFLMIIAIIPGFINAQTSPNTPSGYSIDSQTGNLIPNGALTSSTGWSSSSGSPGWIPNASPLGSFSSDGYTFSYQMEELGRSGVNLGSFNHGYANTNAIFVTGFSYGLQYRFPCANKIGGSCTDTSGLQDNLRVEVGYYPALGTPTFYTHQLGLKNINDGNPAYNPNWQQLAETVTFAGAKTLAQAGSVNMAIVGQDAGFWACLGQECYGPQVKNAYIRANYSVDPCILNPAFNPNCPGFNNVIQGIQSPVYWQSYNIAQRLPHIGGGVQLHGFEYGFNWSNYGACYNTFLFWCTDWRTDGGATINFNVTNRNNVTLYSDSQYRGGNNQSGSYYNRFLFTETQNSLDMGNVNWSLSGVWNHLAVAGWTRPIWTPDPCYFNGLYSPNCTNFKETLNQVLADIKTQQDKIAGLNTISSTLTTSNTVITNTIDTIPTNTSPNVNVTSNLAQTKNTPSQSPNTSLNLALSTINKNKQQQQGFEIQAVTQAITTAENAASISMVEAQNISNLAEKSAEGSIALSIGQLNLSNNVINVQRNTGSTIVNNTTSQQSVSIAPQILNTNSFQSESQENLPTIFEVALPAVINTQNITTQIPQDNIAYSSNQILNTAEEYKQENIAASNLEINLTIAPVIQPNIVAVELPEFKPPIIELQDTVEIVSIQLPKIIVFEPAAPVQPQQQDISSTIINSVDTNSVIESAKEEIDILKLADSRSDIPVDIADLPKQQILLLPPQVVIQTEQSTASVLTDQTAQASTINSTTTNQTFAIEPVTVSQNSEIPQQIKQEFITAAVPVTQVDLVANLSNITTDKTNPINEIIESKSILQGTDQKETKVQLVTSNTQDNDAAAGVSITNIAKIPAGFSSYLIALSDANFYTAKEIYRNQKTVDNVKALRQLASDILHQEMVNQQWR